MSAIKIFGIFYGIDVKHEGECQKNYPWCRTEHKIFLNLGGNTVMAAMKEKIRVEDKRL